MRALTTLILKDNKLLTPEAGKVLSGMLAANTVLKELDVSSNKWEEYGQKRGDGPGFAKELAVGISGNRALLSLNISNNSIVAETQVQEADCQGGSFNAGDLVQYQGEECPVSYTWNDGDIKIVLLSGIKALADGIKNNEAMTSLNLASNRLGVEGAKIIAAILPKCT
jgi:hypothetical protein